MSEPRATFRAKEILGERFEIVRLVGRGGMGEVYEARDSILGELIALKTIRHDLVSSEHIIQRFKRELQLARKVTHANVCRVFDVAHHRHPEGGETIFFTMELLRGESLAERLRREVRLDLRQVLSIATQMANGLAALHSAKVVHRDLKPSNVMLVPTNDGNDRAVITDFGVARRFTSKDSEHTQTQDTAVIGTPDYLAPEQILGKGISPATDVYALGLLLYEMVTGVKPFSSESHPLRRATHQPSPPDIHVRGLDTVWNDAILKCLQPNPEDRFQNALAVIDALEGTAPAGSKESLTQTHSAETESSSFPTRLWSSRRRWIASAAAVLILLGTSVGIWRVSAPTRDTPIEPSSILILPFENLSRDPQNEYFTDGLTDEIIASLSRTGVRILARDSSFRFKSKELDLRQVHDQLHVNFILRGSVRWFEDRLRLTVHMIHVPDGATRSQSYERRRGDVFALQDDLTKIITSEFQVQLAGLSPAIWRRGTQSQEVYELYLKGRYYWNKRDLDNILRAQALFEQAIKLDPKYAEAYVGLADCFSLLPGRIHTPSVDLLSKGKEAALTALSLNPALADAYTALGFLVQRQDWDWERAEMLFRRALDLEPNSPLAHQRLGSLMADLGHNDVAVQEFEKARALDPLSVQLNSAAGITYFYARRYDDAIRQLNRTLELDPNFARPYIFLGDSYIQKNMPEMALSAYEKGVDVTHRDLRWLTALIYGYAKAGKRQQALDLINGELHERIDVKKEPVSLFYLAIPYAGVGDYEKALQILDQGVAERDPDITQIKNYPHFDGLRNDPRFQTLLARMRL